MTTDDVRQRFFELGCEWYSLSGTTGSRDRHDELEAEAVALLRDNVAVLPGISALKRDGAKVAFLPSMVDRLWGRAFPPNVDDLAHGRCEWKMLHDVAARVAGLSRGGDAAEAEALRKAAVSFFSVWLTTDQVDDRIRAEARLVLRKS